MTVIDWTIHLILHLLVFAYKKQLRYERNLICVFSFLWVHIKIYYFVQNQETCNINYVIYVTHRKFLVKNFKIIHSYLAVVWRLYRGLFNICYSLFGMFSKAKYTQLVHRNYKEECLARTLMTDDKTQNMHVTVWSRREQFTHTERWTSISFCRFYDFFFVAHCIFSQKHIVLLGNIINAQRMRMFESSVDTWTNGFSLCVQ